MVTRHWNNCNDHADLNLVLPRISNNLAKQFNLNLVVAQGHVKCTPAYAVLSFPRADDANSGVPTRQSTLAPLVAFTPPAYFWIPKTMQHDSRVNGQCPNHAQWVQIAVSTGKKKYPREVENPFKSRIAVRTTGVLIRC